MDTRQLAAFCAVVERKSFSQAAERLGVTQPAVSLQVRSLEKRLGRKLLDRSGRRVEPTEAGLALYRGAQRMLALEEQLIDELEAGEAGRARAARSRSARRRGRAAPSCPCSSASSSARTPGSPSRSRSPTRRRSSSASPSASSSSASSAPRGATAASSSSRSSATRSCSPARPATASPGRTITLDELREEPLIVMQEGAGVRQVIEDELRRAGTRLRDLEPRLELGLQESVEVGRRRRLRRHLHLARRDRGRSRGRHARDRARRRGSTPRARSRSSARPAARRHARPRRSSSSRASGS